jgi:hypothetical protein
MSRLLPCVVGSIQRRRSARWGGVVRSVVLIAFVQRTSHRDFECKICAVSAAALGKGTPVGREIDTFTSLIYNFKNTDLNGGLDASTLKEPSVPFIEFGQKMLNKEVEFVEFIRVLARNTKDFHLDLRYNLGISWRSLGGFGCLCAEPS